jgi:acetyl-CoA carboxylase biotin carboxyl carrier protein
MDTAQIKDLLKSLRKTDIEEIRYKSDGDALSFKKSNVPQIIKEVLPAPDTNTPTAEINGSIVPIKSTVVGTFYTGAKGKNPPFVNEGSQIKVGQKVGQIEAMKIVKDVLSNVKGEIVEILVEDGAVVEYGQNLILVDTNK